MKKHFLRLGILNILAYGLIVLFNFIDTNSGNPCNVIHGGELAQGKCFDAFVQNNGLLWSILYAAIISLAVYLVFLVASKLYIYVFVIARNKVPELYPSCYL
jgi:hypothetical protein